MESSPLLALLFGLPILALALAVAYRARPLLLDRRGRLVRSTPEQGATDLGPPVQVVLDLRRSIDELQDRLARQGDALSSLFSESAQRLAQRDPGQPPPAAPRQPLRTTAPAPAAPGPALAGGDLPHAVQGLNAEGLSDRAIARRLRIGLEAVRLRARRRPEPAS